MHASVLGLCSELPAREELSAARILERACELEGLRRDGWDHYYTSIGDDGRARFGFDRAPEAGHGGFVAVVAADGSLELDHEHDFRLEEHRVAGACDER